MTGNERGPTIASGGPAETEPRRWVREHRVWVEVVSADSLHGPDRDWVPTGLDVRLYARCPVSCGVDPTRPVCHEIHGRLRALLEEALPVGLRCHVHSFAPALHLRPEAELVPEVELVAEIDQEGEPMSRVDPADRRAARCLVNALAALGVRTRGPGVGTAA